jgi:GNAT superfamily N-acetyltransferase
MGVRLAETEDEIRACFPVMVQLRPHLDAAGFVGRIRVQEGQGFRLAYLKEGEAVVAVAGFRVGDNLAWGHYLYVDDLVTDGESCSAGHGERLLRWLFEHAEEQGCDELHLDSGVQRYDAHRFYLRERMEIRSHHFSRPVGS